MSGRDEQRDGCLCKSVKQRWSIWMGKKQDIHLKIEEWVGSIPHGENRVLWYLQRHGTGGLETAKFVVCRNCSKQYSKGTYIYNKVLFLAEKALLEEGFRPNYDVRIYEVTKITAEGGEK